MKLDLDTYTVDSKACKVNGKYIDRELSWLSFNNRVLYCANSKGLYLNERLKFLGISCSNLDEFISVRYARAISDENVFLKDILNGIKNCLKLQDSIYQGLKMDLLDNGIQICKTRELDKKEKSKLETHFMQNIFPLLTPISIGSTNEIPNFYSGQNCMVITVKQGDSESLNIIPIDKNLCNIIMIGNKAIMIEDVISTFIGHIFINKEISEIGHFRVIKDESVMLDHDSSKFLLDRMMETIENRDMSSPLFLEVSSDTPKRIRNILISIFGISHKNVYSNSEILDYTRFMKTKLLPDEEFSYPKFEPAQYEGVEDTYSIFHALKERDILLQHPYDSYDTVVKFIEHAAVDPKVLAIKQTLYRVSSENSPIVEALCLAARKGKHVSVLVEIKARFDEPQNITLVDKMRRNGVNILLGKEWLKTHCKMCVVIRQEKQKLVVYSHVGTGNYNDKTARLYTDISYLTAKQKIGMDLIHVFNILSGISTPDEKLQKVFYSPVNLRKRMIKNIDREIEFAKKGKKSEIFLKLNSINDPEVINKLYEAANAGVEIYIICRGICSIVPTKNIYIKSIVGRFLEHSRIYAFSNDEHPEYYISSADMLTRNLDRRVEIMLMINGQESVRKLKNIIAVFKEDKVNSFKMDEDGNYKHLKGEFDCHQWFIDNTDCPTIKVAKRDKNKK